MPHPQHLLCRNGWYYLRVRIPKDIAQHFPRQELCKPLKTKDIFLAQNLKRMYLSDIGKVFTLIRSGMLNREQTQEILRSDCLAQLAFHEERRDIGDHEYVGNPRLPNVQTAHDMAQQALAELDFQSHTAHVSSIIDRHGHSRSGWRASSRTDLVIRVSETGPEISGFGLQHRLTQLSRRLRF